jgi:hypothetical protein
LTGILSLLAKAELSILNAMDMSLSLYLFNILNAYSKG